MGWVLSCETGISEVPIFFLVWRRQHHRRRNKGQYAMDLAQSETPCTWRRPLCGTWEISLVPRLRSGPVQEDESRTLNMHAGEKSDWAIVPRKRPNKGRQLLAEVVEGRARPKGNSHQATAVRTQSRGAASIRLAAVRRVASASKPLTVRRLT